jgi:hypothetical protein
MILGFRDPPRGYYGICGKQLVFRLVNAFSNIVTVTILHILVELFSKRVVASG